MVDLSAVVLPQLASRVVAARVGQVCPERHLATTPYAGCGTFPAEYRTGHILWGQFRLIPGSIYDDPFHVIAGLDQAIHSTGISVGWADGMDVRLGGRA